MIAVFGCNLLGSKLGLWYNPSIRNPTMDPNPLKAAGPSPPRGFNIDAPAFEPRADAQVEGFFCGGKRGKWTHSRGGKGAGWLVFFSWFISGIFCHHWFCFYSFFFLEIWDVEGVKNSILRRCIVFIFIGDHRFFLGCFHLVTQLESSELVTRNTWEKIGFHDLKKKATRFTGYHCIRCIWGWLWKVPSQHYHHYDQWDVFHFFLSFFFKYQDDTLPTRWVPTAENKWLTGYITLLIGGYNPIYNWIRGPSCTILKFEMYEIDL